MREKISEFYAEQLFENRRWSRQRAMLVPNMPTPTKFILVGDDVPGKISKSSSIVDGRARIESCSDEVRRVLISGYCTEKRMEETVILAPRRRLALSAVVFRARPAPALNQEFQK